ncbi:MAG: hypothetical protein HOW73_30965 [Polyangiaceae bacterium]|nr:hypothetical protein [Polyangiaceae bacterium]
MRSTAARVRLVSVALLVACGCFGTVGYSKTNPTEITCGCHDPDGCYQGAADLASASGETAESGEDLLYFAQCACFQGSVAGCNTISHFAKDWVAACDAGEKVRDSCAIAGYVHEHGVRVPPINGRSFDRNGNLAAQSFRKACDAGATVVCDRAAP